MFTLEVCLAGYYDNTVFRITDLDSVEADRIIDELEGAAEMGTGCRINLANREDGLFCVYFEAKQIQSFLVFEQKQPKVTEDNED